MLEDIKSGKFNKELSQYIDDGKSPKSFKNLEDKTKEQINEYMGKRT